jgi:hypothetical protein
MSSKAASLLPLILIALAMTGAGISYHFTLDARFAALEQRLDQNAIALQQYEIAQQSSISAKSDALSNLGKEVDTLQASLTPLGKATKDQTDALTQIRQQIASLGQLQQAQQDAQKKLADYAGQLEKIKHDVQLHEAQASAPAPAPPSIPLPANTPAAAPVPAPTAGNRVPTTHASAAATPSPVPPRTETSAVDIRPAEITAVHEHAVRALPVALPANPALSDNR